MKSFCWILVWFLFFDYHFTVGQKQKIHSEAVPKPIGPYSQGIYSEPWIFLSGQIGMDAQGRLDTSIQQQTVQVLENIKNLLQSAGTDLRSVVKVTIYLKDLSDFGKVNEIYGLYFEEPYPARETVEVSRLPKNAKIEISVIARKN